MNKDQQLIWIDLEMTGLNPDVDTIIEIATVITTPQLDIIAEGPEFAIYQSEAVLAQMDEWNVHTHTKSGLLDRVKQSTTTLEEAEKETLSFLEQHVKKGTSPMCGNTVSQDRRFLLKYMPTLESYFHYRHLDVSTLKILAQLWKPQVAKGFTKVSTHTALSDIRDSIDEMRYYREHFIEAC